MSKFNLTFQKVFEYFQRIAGHYPVTMGLIILVSLTTSVFIDQSGELGQFMETKGSPFCSCGDSGPSSRRRFSERKEA